MDLEGAADGVDAGQEGANVPVELRGVTLLRQPLGIQ